MGLRMTRLRATFTVMGVEERSSIGLQTEIKDLRPGAQRRRDSERGVPDNPEFFGGFRDNLKRIGQNHPGATRKKQEQIGKGRKRRANAFRT